MDQPHIRDQLLKHFSVPAEEFGSRWSQLWDKGEFLPWDQGAPSPALADILANRKDIIVGTSRVSGRRKRALVAGCGRGYDVLLLASYGFDVYGLDISESAIKACEKFAEENKDMYPVMDETFGAGKATFISCDFFSKDWEKEIRGGATFELIYDYTFLSAIELAQRPAWALRYKELLSDTTPARLICLEYPTHKDPAERGPPFALPPKIYLAHLTRPGMKISYDADLHLLEDELPPVNPSSTLVRVAHWQPDNTHPIGKGTDWVSVWTHGTDCR
ncbi:MAG: hypothetical protein M1840_005201 [Geoglossum simile]|nr:MAG: hypothetical protein M1840_005201 [Geoglossum simile]